MGQVENRMRLMTEIVLLFQANPGIWENYKGVALRLGRAEEPVQAELVRLVALGLLEQVGSSDQNDIFKYVKPYVSYGCINQKISKGHKTVNLFRIK